MYKLFICHEDNEVFNLVGESENSIDIYNTIQDYVEEGSNVSFKIINTSLHAEPPKKEEWELFYGINRDNLSSIGTHEDLTQLLDRMNNLISTSDEDFCVEVKKCLQ